MRAAVRWIALVLVPLASWAPPPLVQAFNLDTKADRVFGQPGYTTNDANHNGLNASSLSLPFGVAADAQGNLYVSDHSNNRVLEYDDPLTAGADAAADRVFGQPSFFTNTLNSGGPSDLSLNFQAGIALDELGNLYVADTGNNRVLEYDDPLTAGSAADRVFGQPSFITNTLNNGGRSDHSLYFPTSAAIDAQGNLYVTDTNNNRVLEYNDPLSSDHIADRVFGQPNFISNTVNTGGLSNQSLNQPYGVALDGQDNLYVADTNNNRVLEFDAPLTSHQTADKVFGQADFTHNTANHGSRAADTLDHPYGVAVDIQGNLYVADTNNNRVLEYNAFLFSNEAANRVFGQGGSFTTGAVNQGSLSDHSLSFPSSVALDPRGNLYVADQGNNRVLEYDVPVSRGAPTLTAFSPTQVGAGSPAFVLTVNGSGFYGDSVVRLGGSDRPTTFLSSTQLNAVLSAADVSAGGPFAISVFTPAPGGGNSAVVATLSLYTRAGQDTIADLALGQPNFSSSDANNGLMPCCANRLNFPDGAKVDGPSGRLFVADTANNRVLSWPNARAQVTGQPADLALGQPDLNSTAANNGGRRARSLNEPTDMALDAHGNLYVADINNNRVLEYNAPLTSGMAASRVFGQAGSFTTGLGNNGGITASSLHKPAGVALDAHDNLYVADVSNNRVLEYDTPLTHDTIADRVIGETGFVTYTFPTTPTAASLNGPVAVALDAQGNLYVADTDNNRVLEYDAPLTTDASANRVFGQPDFSHNDFNNPGESDHSLSSPGAVALDGQGNLYVADTFNSRVLEYDRPLTSDRKADRVFGQPDFTQDIGGVTSTSLGNPGGVALDAQGNLYVADHANSRVLEYDHPLPLLRDFLPLLMR